MCVAITSYLFCRPTVTYIFVYMIMFYKEIYQYFLCPWSFHFLSKSRREKNTILLAGTTEVSYKGIMGSLLIFITSSFKEVKPQSQVWTWWDARERNLHLYFAFLWVFHVVPVKVCGPGKQLQCAVWGCHAKFHLCWYRNLTDASHHFLESQPDTLEIPILER